MDADDRADRAIGRLADAPNEIPPGGWVRIVTRAWRAAGADNVSLVAAGVAFYSLLAVFPGIAALIALFGLVADPAQVEGQFAALSAVLPVEVYQLLSQQMREVASGSGQSLGAGLAGAILLSVWSATRATRSLIAALNIVYDERERRGFLRLNLTAFVVTFSLVLLVAVVLALIVAVPVAMRYVGLGSLAQVLVNLVRWPVLAALALTLLAVLYRYGPSRRQARWRWVSVGSSLAVVLWLVASALFSVYVSRFGTYNATYGSIGAVIVLLMWLYLSALITILGAELNAEIERQTARDTTRGESRPRGERGAYVADHLPDDGPSAD
ncbi:YihY/virulence factor BrkB family protein [Marichromatium gracile]|uniref:YihY/virulence factor BrkB family protein n=1 Tax=Marichromatium gracile TaxID=1048 RepID=UPI001F309305|nr:YihY/virulence factor BrkB family protein [Marichromatium gracile]MCF1183293.1 YihY/virulence factor BrkB family protein [Marichromatium gracile]